MILLTASGIAKQNSGKYFDAKNPTKKEKSFKKSISNQETSSVMNHSLHPGEIIVLTVLFTPMITVYPTSNSVFCFSGRSPD